MKLTAADKKKLPSTLAELSGALEELLLTGLTTVSKATQKSLDVAFREASRLGLLRLSSTMRILMQELGRYAKKSESFSQRRMTFFLNRAWLLSQGLQRALREGDDTELTRLLWTPASRLVKGLQVVTVGVSKKIAAGAFCAFEFRLRTIGESKLIEPGHRLTWSTIFPLKSGVDLPAEGFLHVPQKQKFRAAQFLEGKVLTIENSAVALDEFGGGRLSLTDTTTVSPGDDFTDWESCLEWDAAAMVERIQRHTVTPFDLEVELQDEVYLEDWTLGSEETPFGDGQVARPLFHRGVEFTAIVSTGREGQELHERLGQLQMASERDPLFGLLHFDMCRLVLQPLTLFSIEGPQHLMISDKQVDKAALLKSLKF